MMETELEKERNLHLSTGGGIAVSEPEVNETSVAIEPQIHVKGGKAYAFFKRTFDIVSSAILIIVISPILLILALLVKCTSKGPILFKDERIGKKGKKIKVYKFRSMYVDAESRMEKYLTPEQLQQWKIERKIENDPRVTKIGKFLRKTSLDELPQLFNILGGSLSVVGPRPITEMELMEHFTIYQRNILLSARPGLLGYWAVCGRSNVTFESGERQRLELEYFEKRSFLFDFSLIFKTIPAVLGHKGAK